MFLLTFTKHASGLPFGILNPDQVIANAMQAKMEVYKAKEHFESILKIYNDQNENLIGLVNLMKTRILELEDINTKLQESKEEKAAESVS